MASSPFIQNARQQINAVKGKSLSLAERENASITLAAALMEEALRIQTSHEKQLQAKLAGMMQNEMGKVFITAMTDQCFRSQNPYRVANQLNYLIHRYGIPTYLPASQKTALFAFTLLSRWLAPILVPLTIRMVRQETAHVILPGEKKELIAQIQTLVDQGVRVNLNHLGEAILGEGEASRRLGMYLNDLNNRYIDCISVKISTLYSQINLLAWNETLTILKERLRGLYRAAMKHQEHKFVNLDMEEYRDLHLTVELFMSVLDEPEFLGYSAGIALQSYLPNSYPIQQKLTAWSLERCRKGGVPIKIRIVKGANLAMEQIEAAVRLWPQAPYTSKKEADANFKKMVLFAFKPEHAEAVHIGIGSHNLFDIAHALLLASEHGVEDKITFEMLEGMADHIRRVVQTVSRDTLLYCPAAKRKEYQNAVAYLIRRLDENTSSENFLRHMFNLLPQSNVWKDQAALFSLACNIADEVSSEPRRKQDRLHEKFVRKINTCFQNEPDTDWSLPANQQWAAQIYQSWSGKQFEQIPLVIGGEQIKTGISQPGIDPSTGKSFYTYSQATMEHIDAALATAKKHEREWAVLSPKNRAYFLAEVANQLRENRHLLIGAMMADTGKTMAESDPEVSEAIDLSEYYRINLEEWISLKDIQWHPKGTVVIAPPWNFPCSIPAGGILAALAAGNCVLFKPAAEAVLVGWELVQLFWKAGISRHVLQFITCEDEPIGSRLIQDPRVSTVVLTGGTKTAQFFLKLRSHLDLIAETGGKNVMVITAMSDRDLAIRDLIHSAFSYSGQKCSACSLAILEAEVYDDLHFRKQLQDAAASLYVGSAWDPQTRVNPLIRFPNPTLLRGLTTLEEGQEWLLKPRQHPHNPCLWSPGIKLGVKPGSFTFENELFGPVLGIVRAKDVQHAFQMMNQTRYGLTAGIHTLDIREQTSWLRNVEAGNCYINRTTTGAIVQRQPFGGCKDSNFGKGAKAGGPNYLTQLMSPYQISLPHEQEKANENVQQLSQAFSLLNPNGEELKLWRSSMGSYAFYWNHYFSKPHDPSKVLGQDNIFHYVPHKQMILRVQQDDLLLDVFRVMAAALTCGLHLEVSDNSPTLTRTLQNAGMKKNLISIIQEEESDFIKRLENGMRVRIFTPPSDALQEALVQKGCRQNRGIVLANGRLELLQYLREVSLSRDYHRYGNLGERESKPQSCEGCHCHE